MDSTNNEVIRKRVVKLQDLLQSMSYYNWDHPHKPGPHWIHRPECSQVLAKYNEWFIDKNCLKTDSTLKLIQQNDYKFFAEYFNAKYEGIEAKLENIHLNSQMS